MKRVWALTLVGAALCTGCSVVNAGRQSSPVDVCAEALPVARTSAGEGSQLRSIKRLTLEQANELLGRVGATPLVRPTVTPTPLPSPTNSPRTPDPLSSPGSARLCGFVYSGTFAKASLPASPTAMGEDSGKGLLVVVTVRRPHVIAQAVVADIRTVR